MVKEDGRPENQKLIKRFERENEKLRQEFTENSVQSQTNFLIF
jgi:hypothetical protein